MAKGDPAGVPVDLARLRQRFPALTDEDVAAYVAATRRILDAGGDTERARITRELLATGRRAREKAARGEALGPDEAAGRSYLAAVDKMQHGQGH